MIDINQPLKHDQDMILNIDGEEAVLGSAADFAKQASQGSLISLPPNDNPDGDTNPGDNYDNGPKRDKNGQFVKNS